MIRDGVVRVEYREEQLSPRLVEVDVVAQRAERRDAPHGVPTLRPQERNASGMSPPYDVRSCSSKRTSGMAWLAEDTCLRDDRI